MGDSPHEAFSMAVVDYFISGLVVRKPGERRKRVLLRHALAGRMIRITIVLHGAPDIVHDTDGGRIASVDTFRGSRHRLPFKQFQRFQTVSPTIFPPTRAEVPTG